jgi:hypothetical protein
MSKNRAEGLLLVAGVSILLGLAIQHQYHAIVQARQLSRPPAAVFPSLPPGETPESLPLHAAEIKKRTAERLRATHNELPKKSSKE